MARGTKAAKSARSARVARQTKRVADEAVVETGSAQPYLLLGSGYQAASQDPSRGYIYWPQTDTRRQITSWTRYEITRRIQFLYAHFGFIRRLVNGMARMLGYLTPQPNTSDEEWNELAFARFMEICGSAILWDRCGKFDFFEGQIQDNISIFRDGDGVIIKTMGPGGRARMAYYEAHQLVHPDGGGPEWVDGVKVGPGGNHVAYSLQDGEDTTMSTIIDAWKCIYLGNFENRGQVRPLSILHAAVLNMIDVVETRGFTKHAIKSHSRLGTVVEQEMGQGVSSTGGGVAGPLISTNVLMSDGNYQPFNYELVMNGGQTPLLKPGQKVRVVADDRPTPNNMEFERAVLTDCCHAVDLSYQRLCDLSSVTGPGLRMLNADDKRWIKLRHYKQAKRCQAMYHYALAIEIDAGRLPMPRLPAGEYWWNQCQWIGLAAPDIDGGRTAQATLTDLQSGQTHWLETWGQKGVYWKRAIRQSVAEVIFAHLECRHQEAAAKLPAGTVTAEKVFPMRFAGGWSQAPVAPSRSEPSAENEDRPIAPGEPDPDDPIEGED